MRVPDLTTLAAARQHRRVTQPFSPADFAGRFAQATRTAGSAAVELAPEEQGALARAGLSAPRADDLERALLLLDAATLLDAGPFTAQVRERYRHGDNREREGVLRALPHLPGPERFAPLAVDACRSSVQTIFEAIACENPYPAAHFLELNFNQMVLKAVFLEIPLARVVRLRDRLGPELSRMADDYARERAAAGRSVPADLALLVLW